MIFFTAANCKQAFFSGFPVWWWDFVSRGAVCPPIMRNDFRQTKAAVKGLCCHQWLMSCRRGRMQFCSRTKRKRIAEYEPSQCSREWSSAPPQTASCWKRWRILANDLPSIRQSIPHHLLNWCSKVRSSSSVALSCSSSGNLQAGWHAGTFQHIPSPPRSLLSWVCSQDLMRPLRPQQLGQ